MATQTKASRRRDAGTISNASDDFVLFNGRPDARFDILTDPDASIRLQDPDTGLVSRTPPLHFAAGHECHLGAVKELLRYFVDPDLRDDSPHRATPVQRAFAFFLDQASMVILRGEGTNAVLAVEERYAAIIRALLEVGADPDQSLEPADCNCAGCRMVPTDLKTAGIFEVALRGRMYVLAETIAEFADPVKGKQSVERAQGRMSRTEAAIARKLLAVIDKRKTEGKPKVLCRCQSGLAYLECHGDPTTRGTLRYPMEMLCPCGYKKGQTYGSCCGKRGIKLIVDSDFGVKELKTLSGEAAKTFIKMQELLTIENGGVPPPPDSPLFPGLTKEEYEDSMECMLKQAGAHPAYIYCQKKADFQWIPRTVDMLPRGEAAKRVGEWNEALEAYIAEKKLSESEARSLRWKFGASILFRCGGCKTKERKPWQFKRCSGRNGATCSQRYCGSECQVVHWKAAHKDACGKGGVNGMLEDSLNSAVEGWADPEDAIDVVAGHASGESEAAVGEPDMVPEDLD